MEEKQRVEFISHVFTNLHNTISFTDSKANTTLSVQSLLFAVGLGVAIVSDTFDSLSDLDNTFLTVIFFSGVFLFILCSFAGIFSSVLVYKARTFVENGKPEAKGGLIYFQHITAFKTFEDYFIDIQNADDKRIAEEYSKQVYVLAPIAELKMKYVNLATFLLTANICLITIILLLSMYINTT